MFLAGARAFVRNKLKHLNEEHARREYLSLSRYFFRVFIFSNLREEMAWLSCEALYYKCLNLRYRQSSTPCVPAVEHLARLLRWLDGEWRNAALDRESLAARRIRAGSADLCKGRDAMKSGRSVAIT